MQGASIYGVSLASVSLVPCPLRGGEKGPGTQCMRMRKVYRNFSSIIRRMPMLSCGWVAGADPEGGPWTPLGAEEQLIMERTRHCNIDGACACKHTSEEQHRFVSNVLNAAKN